MKNTLVLLALATIFLASCSKEENTITPVNQPQSGNLSSVERISAVPATFQQKVLLESFTSVVNGKCPLNEYLIDMAKEHHPGQVIAATFHRNDIMRTAATSELFNLTGETDPLTLPAVMMNRIQVNSSPLIGDTSWTSLISSELNQSQNCGLAIKSEIDAVTNKIKMYVHAGFNSSATGNYNLCVYLIENSLSTHNRAYDQANSYNNDSQNPYYNAGNPIPGYTHKNIVRKAVTSVSGIPIPGVAQLAGGQMVQRLSAMVPEGLTPDDCSIIALLYDPRTLRVLNVQQAKLGATKDWN